MPTLAVLRDTSRDDAFPRPEPAGGAERTSRGPARWASVVVHDVAPARWQACSRLLRSLREEGDFPVSLLVVPRYHGQSRDRGFEQWLRLRHARGDEIVLHGYTHLDPGRPRGPIDWLRRRVYTRGEGEFVALTRTEASQRLRAGRAWLEAMELAPEGFVAPAWLLGAGAWEALRREPFGYTCTLDRLVLLPEGRGLHSRAQVWSNASAWRRWSSLAWNAALARWQAGNPWLRLELHPDDADDIATERAWKNLLQRALHGGRRGPREMLTLAQVAARLRAGEAGGGVRNS